MKYYPVFAALILLAGCTNLNIFGGDVLKIEVKSEAEGPKDILVINDIETIPRSPVLPGQEVRLFFNIENRDDTKEAKNVKVELFNPSSFKNAQCLPTCDFTSILPGGQEQVQIIMTAPSEGDIAGVKLETDLNFRVTYRYETSTIMETLIVNMNEILARQRQGQSVTLERNNIMGSGPVRVEGEIKGVPYVLAGQPGDKQAGIFVFTVKNIGDKGKGTLVNGKIEPCTEGGQCVGIFFPSALGALKCPNDNCGKFTCFAYSGPGPVPGTVCINKEPIELFKGESSPFRFDIVNSPNIPEPFRTHSIRADVAYDYELRGSVHIIVNPLQNV